MSRIGNPRNRNASPGRITISDRCPFRRNMADVEERRHTYYTDEYGKRVCRLCGTEKGKPVDIEEPATAFAIREARRILGVKGGRR